MEETNPETQSQQTQKLERIFSTGRRKESVAKVQLMEGKGEIIVNARPCKEYFPIESHRVFIHEPLAVTNSLNKFKIIAKIEGGGIFGQAGALRLGIARALASFDPNLTPILRDKGLLTRNPCMKERKKYGQKGARKRFQWTKR